MSMSAPCKVIKYKPKRRSRPVIKIRKLPPPDTSHSDPSHFNYDQEGEEEVGEADISILPQRNTFEELRIWVRKQRFIPQDLSDELLALFLSGVGFELEATKNKILKYFYSRQEPCPLFRDRDPLSPENVAIFAKMYAFPLPDSTDDGCKIIIAGLTEPVPTYNTLDHAKVLAMTLDLLIWEKDFGFGDFVVVLDARGFSCPQLLERKVFNHILIRNLLLDTIPGTLRAFYFLYPPSYVANVVNSRNGIWIKVVENKKQMLTYLPRDILPLELGGNLGHIEDLKAQWLQHLEKSREFFIHFEKRMINDYKRRLCYERERKQKSWVSKLKLEADEWEYKIHYYEKMKNMEPLTHPAFGPNRIANLEKEKKNKIVDPIADLKKFIKDQEQENFVF